MTKQVVQYARVSTEEQNKSDSVSLDQQISEMDVLRDRNEWQVVDQFIDCENYVATQSPKKGKVVNPSGERADRPEFLKMLELVKTGQIDAIVCWRDDRLVRHPRVAVALEDALDIGDAHRLGKSKVEIYDATGAMIDRFTLSIKATIWREENKRRAERVKMGKIGTLKEGRWPGTYERLGYETVREPGERGCKIVLADDREVQAVRRIFYLCDSGLSLQKLRKALIAEGIEQKGIRKRKHDWHVSIISSILHTHDYTGAATYRFSDGIEYTIGIPQIVDQDMFDRCQKRLAENAFVATRNSKGVYLLQGILRCGECGATMRIITRRRFKRYNKIYQPDNPIHRYSCTGVKNYPDEPHSKKWRWGGKKLDWLVWRYIVDRCIKRPDLINAQVLARQAELRAQGDSITGDIARARTKLQEVDQERAFYQKQAARGKMTETEFDARMDETQDTYKYWQSEVERLKELRDDAQKVKVSLDYVTELLTSLQAKLESIDQTPTELNEMPAEERSAVLKERRKIILSLCETVRVYADWHIEIDGVLDGSEAAQFGLGGLSVP